MKCLAYVGSETDDKNPCGLHILECDTDTGDFRVLNSLSYGENPTYGALTRDGRFFYTVTGRKEFGDKSARGGLQAYAVEGENLKPLNCVPTGHTVPCHISLSPDEKTLCWAEYSHATCGFAELAADGSISNVRCMTQHFGSGPNLTRQEKAHAHCAIVTPDSKYQLVVDLGIDQIKAYDFANRAKVGMKEVAAATIHTFPPGGGPRHVIFQANGRIMYVIFELLNLVASYRYDGEKFEFIEERTLIADAALSRSCKASAVKLSEDGRQLFCSNRDCTYKARETITIFNTDPETGRMEFLSETPVNGIFPRDFEFMPGGKFVLVAYQLDGHLASFAYNRTSGKFTLVKRSGGFHKPLYVRFKV